MNTGYEYAAAWWEERGYRLSMSINRKLYDHIFAVVKPKHITLEFGCGVSTFAFINSHWHTAIESNQEQAKLFEQAVYCPLKGKWYSDYEYPTLYDVVLIDGPFTRLGDRRKAIDVVPGIIKPKSWVFVDDTHREPEKQLVYELAEVTGKMFSLRDRYAVLK